MITCFKWRSVRGRAWRRRFTVVVVMVAALTLAPAAFADGWTLQSVPTPSGTLSSQLFGVSCPATNDCFAVGLDEQSSGQVALIEHWNGSSWSVFNLGGPGSTSDLDSVSCPTTSFCEAVGSYSTSAADQFPLAYTWGTGGFAQPPVPVTAGDFDDYLTSVSCQSSSFCLAVGVDNSAVTLPLVEEWTGSAFGRLPGGDNSGKAVLNAVSCAAAQSFYCLGVGGETTADGVVRPYVVQFDDGGLESISNTSDGRFVVQPSGTPDAVLTGVSCLEASLCSVIGNYYGTTAQTEINPWAAITTSSGWSLQSVPPSDANAGFGTGDSVNCPSECWAVGDYIGSNGLALFADTLAGSTWEFASLPNPPGTEQQLNAVSCAAINYCESVGWYRTSPTSLTPFAEQYFYAPPSTGCAHPPCRPPQPGTPHHFALTASGTERHGATVIAVLYKPRTLVLLVQVVRHHRDVIVGLVPLGHYRVGTFRIPWNLRVDGTLPGKGTYDVSLHSISVDVLSPATPPGEIRLTVNANRQVKVGK